MGKEGKEEFCNKCLFENFSHVTFLLMFKSPRSTQREMKNMRKKQKKSPSSSEKPSFLFDFP